MAFIIIISRFLQRFLNLFHYGGTSLVGSIALKLKPSIIKELSSNINIVCVTGTNGKTTTCAMICEGYKKAGIDYFSNTSGANMLNGIATAFINNSKLNGKPKHINAILECDENSLPLITSYIDADVIVVTNIFRDQLDRYTEITSTKNQIIKGIRNSKNATIVLNADCPITYSIMNYIDNDIITFGIGAEIESFSPTDITHCPCCSSKLSYKSHSYAQLGDFYCGCCGYKRAIPTLNVTSISKLDNGYSIVLNNKTYDISVNGVYNVYNFLSASCVLKLTGLNPSLLSSFNGTFGRLERFYNIDQEITLLLVKNPVGFQNCIKYISSSGLDMDAAFCLNDNDADGKDVSWIWDVNFSGIKNQLADVYCFGTRSKDMCLRLKYDDIVSIPYDNEEYDKLISLIKSSKRDFVIFATYTAMMKLRHKLIANFGGDEFWQ